MHVDVEGYEWLIHSTQASQPGELIGMNIGPDLPTLGNVRS